MCLRKSDNTPEISIIVPVYNVEKYIRQSLDSIRQQTFCNWECILIDDGSPDNSGKICDEYAKVDPRFKVIHSENGGTWAARNSGLAVARAPFIGFVDPDDWIEPNMYEIMLRLIKEYDADMVEGSLAIEYTTFTKKKQFASKGNSVLDRRQTIRELYLDKSLPNYLWNKLFKRDVINVPFQEYKVYEDIYAMTCWAENMHKVVISPEIIYHYRCRRGSSINSNYATNGIAFLKVLEDRVKTFQVYEPEVFNRTERIAYLLNGAISSAKVIARKEPDEKVRREAIEKISKMVVDYGYPPFWKLGPKKFFRAILLRSHPHQFCKLMRKLSKTKVRSKHREDHKFD